MKNIKRKILDNGLVLLTEQIPHENQASIAIGIKVGSIDEPLSLNGASHFNEHLLFKSNKYRTRQKIIRDLEGEGTEINASTYRTITMMVAKGLPDKIHRTIPIYFQCLNNFEYNQKEFETEKDVILGEIKEERNDHLTYLTESIISHLFKGTALEQPILGNLKTIKSITKKELEQFKEKFYVSNNMIIAVAGNFQEDIIEKQVIENFGSLKPHKLSKNGKHISLENSFKEIIKTRRGIDNEIYFELGWRVPGKKHEDFYALKVIEGILSAGMSSRIFEELREKRGLGYRIEGHYISFENIGSFGICVCNLLPNKLKEAKKIVLEQFDSLKNKIISDEEIGRTKNLLISTHRSIIKDISYRTEKILETERYNLPHDFRDSETKIKEITKKQIREVANKYFDTKNYTMFVLVPSKN